MSTMPAAPFAGRSPDWKDGYQFGIDTFSAELKNAKERFASRDFRWLIEAPGPRYLAVQRLSITRDLEWTADHNKALAFRSQEQADDLMMAVRQLDRLFCSGRLFAFEVTLGNARPVEHGWMDPSGPPRPSSPPTHMPVG